MNNITILKESCGGCPMIWDVILPDGSEGYIKYRWSWIGLFKVDEQCGLFRDPIETELIGDSDELSGVLELSETVAWLGRRGYEVVISENYSIKEHDDYGY